MKIPRAVEITVLVKGRVETPPSSLFRAIVDEARRQEEHIELIASENYASPRVMEAQGSVLTNKYAEGYPGKRYYGGCEHVDVAETLAIERAMKTVRIVTRPCWDVSLSCSKEPS